MFAMGKKVLSFLVLVCMAASPLACLNINKSPDDKPKTEVNVGGQHGVTVDHQSDTQDKQNNK
jgi:hypothetical protein